MAIQFLKRLEFDSNFEKNFFKYLQSLYEIAEHYETVSDQLERNPILAIDYLKRAFLITGEKRLRVKAKNLLKDAGIQNRAQNSVELMAATF